MPDLGTPRQGRQVTGYGRAALGRAPAPRDRPTTRQPTRTAQAAAARPPIGPRYPHAGPDGPPRRALSRAPYRGRPGMGASVTGCGVPTGGRAPAPRQALPRCAGRALRAADGRAQGRPGRPERGGRPGGRHRPAAANRPTRPTHGKGPDPPVGGPALPTVAPAKARPGYFLRRRPPRACLRRSARVRPSASDRTGSSPLSKSPSTMSPSPSTLGAV